MLIDVDRNLIDAELVKSELDAIEADLEKQKETLSEEIAYQQKVVDRLLIEIAVYKTAEKNADRKNSKAQLEFEKRLSNAERALESQQSQLESTERTNKEKLEIIDLHLEAVRQRKERFVKQ